MPGSVARSVARRTSENLGKPRSRTLRSKRTRTISSSEFGTLNRADRVNRTFSTPGVAPAALFQSVDGGETWSEVLSLTNHPNRSRWQPGAGGLCLHSIVIDPANQNRMFVGISAVGVFRSDDSAETWQPANNGTRAEFLPDKFPEFGQCVHKLLLAGDDGSLLFQQNHCGVYRSRNAGADWVEITAGLPSDFGFPLAVHPQQPETLYVIPLQGAEFRCPPGGKLSVYRSRDGGRAWEPLDKVCRKKMPT